MIVALSFPIEDLVENAFPGTNCTMKSHMFSGYLDALTSRKELHYILVESEDRFNTDPVMIWFNGGPGCSSMLGMFMENGPCVVDDDSDVFFDNPYSWSSRLNMLYIEGPAGVGYSWARDAADKKFNDQTSADDFLTALIHFYKKFPEFKKNELYISGESYAGIYIPYLAMRIHQHNQQQKTHGGDLHINLKGVLIGNGCTDWEEDVNPAMPDFFYMHNVLDYNSWKQWHDNGCKTYFQNIYPSVVSDKCEEIEN